VPEYKFAPRLTVIQIGEVVTTIPTVGFNVEYAALLLLLLNGQ
jgi:hypothetical protein